MVASKIGTWVHFAEYDKLQAEIVEYKIREETYIEMAGEQSAEIVEAKKTIMKQGMQLNESVNAKEYCRLEDEIARLIAENKRFIEGKPCKPCEDMNIRLTKQVADYKNKLNASMLDASLKADEIEKLKSGNEALRADNDAKARVICDELDIDKELKRKIIELENEALETDLAHQRDNINKQLQAELQLYKDAAEVTKEWEESKLAEIERLKELLPKRLGERQ
jgi:hypothetical protein